MKIGIFLSYIIITVATATGSVYGAMFTLSGDNVQYQPLLSTFNEKSKIKKYDKLQSNIDLVNDNVYTNFGLNKSIRSQDTEQKPNSDVYQGL